LKKDSRLGLQRVVKHGRELNGALFRGIRSVKCRSGQTLAKGISSSFDLQQQMNHEAARDSTQKLVALEAKTPVSSSSWRPRVLREQKID